MNLTRTCVVNTFVMLSLTSSVVEFGLAAESPPNSGDRSALTATYEGCGGPGNGKHIVLIAADWEYRSEEALPMLARILAERHGFRCTVLFAVDPETGKIDPNIDTNIPGLEVLEDADLMVTLMMMLELPDAQMKHIVDYVESGRPVLGLRCSTLAFKFERNKTSAYYHYRTKSTEWPGGFGKQVLGETWCGHHGKHKFESTRGAIHGPNRDHPILRGVRDVWGPTDVYTINGLPADATILMHGLVLKGMKPDDPPNLAKPLMPLVWTREFDAKDGRRTRTMCSTIASAVDFQSEDLRRLVVNGCYWLLNMEEQIVKRANVDFVGDYKASYYGRNEFVKGRTPAYYQRDDAKPTEKHTDDAEE